MDPRVANIRRVDEEVKFIVVGLAKLLVYLCLLFTLLAVTENCISVCSWRNGGCLPAEAKIFFVAPKDAPSRVEFVMCMR
jgi:hypothetical protein